MPIRKSMKRLGIAVLIVLGAIVLLFGWVVVTCGPEILQRQEPERVEHVGAS